MPNYRKPSVGSVGIYEMGIKFLKVGNIPKAIFYFEETVKGGVGFGLVKLGDIYSTKNGYIDFKKAYDSYSAIMQTSSEARYKAGRLKYSGYGTKQDKLLGTYMIYTTLGINRLDDPNCASAKWLIQHSEDMEQLKTLLQTKINTSNLPHVLCDMIFRYV